MQNLSRRDLVRATFAGGLAASALPAVTAAGSPRQTATRYIAAYDTESPECLPACRRIVEVHRKYEIPATFFILGTTLQANSAEYRKLLDDPLFEVASHTYSHKLLRDNALCGSAVPMEDRRSEIFKGKQVVENIFERPCIGMRPGVGFDKAFEGQPRVLAMIHEAGFKYVSSLLWGPDCSLPALPREPFTYQADGFVDLWELPAQGWHENLLKNHNQWGPRRLTLWPPPFPGAIPESFCKTPADEFKVNRVFMDRTMEIGGTCVSLIWHPWSLAKFDPDMKMLELTFDYVRRSGLRPCTFAQLHAHVSSTSG